MAEKVTVELVDDLDGSIAAETVQFQIDGSAFQIDLSRRNATKLREHLATYISKSRAVTKSQADETRAARTTSADVRRRNQEIREWARANGHVVSERGRIPHELQLRFLAATGGN